MRFYNIVITYLLMMALLMMAFDTCHWYRLQRRHFYTVYTLCCLHISYSDKLSSDPGLGKHAYFYYCYRCILNNSRSLINPSQQDALNYCLGGNLRFSRRSRTTFFLQLANGMLTSGILSVSRGWSCSHSQLISIFNSTIVICPYAIWLTKGYEGHS